MLAILSLISFCLFQTSFRFFFWLILMEILMVQVILLSKHGSSVYICSLLVFGACEVGVALSIIVCVSRFSGLEKTHKFQCEGF